MFGQPLKGPMRARDHYLYRRWNFMRQVCYNKNNADYKKYGARGIGIDPDFEEFWDFVDIIENKLGPPPFGKQSRLARIDQDGDYTIKNLKWDKSKEIGRRTRKAFKLRYKNRTRALRDWCEEYNINLFTALGRIQRGWRPAQVLGIQPPPRSIKTK